MKAGQDSDLSAAGMRIHQDATIQVHVRELRGAELGLLNVSDKDEQALERVKAQATSRKIAEDKHWFGVDPAAARDPQRNPYCHSPAHIAWSEATSLRCAGRLDPHWLREFDPYGGTLCQGAMIVPGGQYPHALSKMAFAHSADWKLGRFFDAGPLSGLYDSDVRQPELGFYGLSSMSPVEPKLDVLYGVAGHPDWDIDYAARVRLQSTEPALATSGPAGMHSGGEAAVPHLQRFDELMQHLESSGVASSAREDCAAALLEAMVAARFDLDLPVSAILGTKDNVIAMRGTGDAMQRVAVDIASAEGAYARWRQGSPASTCTAIAPASCEHAQDRSPAITGSKSSIG